MWPLLALSACAPVAPDVGPPADDAGLLLYASETTALIQHDTLHGTRLAPDVELYAVAPSAAASMPSPGAVVDLWVHRDDSGFATIRDIEQVATAPLPAHARDGGYPLSGVVVRVDPTAIVVDHTAVDGLMPAMVMPFDVRPDTAASLHTGARITATVLPSDYGMVLVNVQTVGQTDAHLSVADPLAVGEVLPQVSLDSPVGPVVVGAGQDAPTLVAFIYTTCPDPTFCPATVSRLQAVLPLMPDDARIVTVTIDPEHDTLDVLRDYGVAVGAPPGRWWLARPSPVQLQALAVAAGLTVSVRSGRITHSTRLLALDANGTVLERFDDNAFDPAHVADLLSR